MCLPGRAQQLARGPEGGERAQEPLPRSADLYVPPGALAGRAAGGAGDGLHSPPGPPAALARLQRPPLLPVCPLCQQTSSHFIFFYFIEV